MSRRVITWNVNSIIKRIDDVREILIKYKPSYLLLQETRVSNEKFPEIGVEGYCCYKHEGFKGRAGVCIISDHEMEVVEEFEGRYIECRDEYCSIASVYLFNGGSALSPVEEKIRFLNIIYEKAKKKERYVVGGDFNVLHKKDECTSINPYLDNEMDTLKKLETVLQYRTINKPYLTWWDYRTFAFDRNIGMGIDKIYVTHDIKSFSHLIVLTEYREYKKNKSPSDHAPVMMTFV